MPLGEKGRWKKEGPCHQVLQAWGAGYGSFQWYYCNSIGMPIAKETQTVHRLWYKLGLSWNSRSRFVTSIVNTRSGRRLGHYRRSKCSRCCSGVYRSYLNHGNEKESVLTDIKTRVPSNGTICITNYLVSVPLYADLSIFDMGATVPAHRWPAL